MAREIEVGENLSFILLMLGIGAVLCFLAWCDKDKKPDAVKIEVKAEASK